MALASSSNPIDKFRFRAYVFNNPVSGLGSAAAQAIHNGYIDLGIAGFSYVRLPEQTTNTIRYRENIDPARMAKAPGLSEFTPMILRRGSTEDVTFWRWALLSHNPGLKASLNRNLSALTPLKLVGDNPFPRRDMVIEALDRDNSTVRRRWYALETFVTKFSPGEMDSNESTYLLEEVTLECEVFFEVNSIDEIVLLAGTEVAALIDNDYARTAAYAAQASHPYK